MVKRSNLSEDERLRRKRLAARLRQQRCRARKRNREKSELKGEHEQKKQGDNQSSSSLQTEQGPVVNNGSLNASISSGLPASSTFVAPIQQQTAASVETGARQANQSPLQGLPIPPMQVTSSVPLPSVVATAAAAPVTATVSKNPSNDHTSRYVLIQPRPSTVSSATPPPPVAAVTTHTQVNVSDKTNASSGDLQVLPVGSRTCSAFQPYPSNQTPATEVPVAHNVQIDQQMKASFFVDSAGRIFKSNGDIHSLANMTPSASVSNIQSMITAAPAPVQASHEVNHNFIVTSQTPTFSTTSGPIFVITETRYVLPTVSAPVAGQGNAAASGHQVTMRFSPTSSSMPPPPAPSHTGLATNAMSASANTPPPACLSSSVSGRSLSVPAGTVLSNGQVVTGMSTAVASNPPTGSANKELKRIVTQTSCDSHQKLQQAPNNNAHPSLNVLNTSTRQKTWGTISESPMKPSPRKQQLMNVSSAFRRVAGSAAPAPVPRTGAKPSEQVPNMTPPPAHHERQQQKQQPVMTSQLMLPSWSIDSQDTVSAAASRVAIPTNHLRRALILSPPPTPACINAAASVARSSSSVPSSAIPNISGDNATDRVVQHQKQSMEPSLPPRKRSMVEFKEAPIYLQPSAQNDQTNASKAEAPPVRSDGKQGAASNSGRCADDSSPGSPTPVEPVGTFSASSSPNTPGSLYHRRSASEVAKIEAVDAILSLKSPDRTSPLSPHIYSNSSASSTPKKRSTPMMPASKDSARSGASPTSAQKGQEPLMPRFCTTMSKKKQKEDSENSNVALNTNEATLQELKPRLCVVRPSLAPAVSPSLQPKQERFNNRTIPYSIPAPANMPQKNSTESKAQHLVATPEVKSEKVSSWEASQRTAGPSSKVSPDGSQFESFNFNKK